MSATISIILVLGFAVIYIGMIEIFSVLFRISGLTKEKSLFQTISLITTAGFTTSESEVIVTNKMRRRIAIAAMVTGNVFSVVIVSLIINLFMSVSTTTWEKRSLIITGIAFGVFALLMILFRIPFIRKIFDKLIESLAITAMKKRNHENAITFLDNYGHGMCIAEILINFVPDMLKDKSLFESKIKDVYNMNVLLIKRKRKIIEVTKDTMLQTDDVIVVFGSSQNIKDLFGKQTKKDIKEALSVEDKINENIITLIDNYGPDAMAEVTINSVPEIFVDKTLFESGIKENYQINVMMVKRDDKPIMVVKDTVIEDKDVIVVFGPYKSIKELFGPKNR
ncbi:MAG: TrkA C-terminal domain-containing protein [Bacilli bacterium]|nr:TrkA C-terminal domain-containing protein [Bacilli bacterium]